MSISLHLQALEARCKDVEADKLVLERKLEVSDHLLMHWQNEAIRRGTECVDYQREIETLKMELGRDARRAESAIADARLWQAEALRLKLELEHLKLAVSNP